MNHAKKPPTNFTVDAGPGTLWKIRVFVWPTMAALLGARNVGNKGIQIRDCDAFCRQFSASYATKSEKVVIAEMHFHAGNLKPSTIVHESTHAAIAYLKLAKLDLETYSGDEQFTQCVEHIFSGATWGIRNLVQL